ncbi:MAG: hypothetical protein SFU53_02150 [Terrimicrobiaceae bacterium]|nr:hypothetical protein [Terrimicrobiaceae bacterium]
MKRSILLLLALPVLSFAQTPPPDSGPGGFRERMKERVHERLREELPPEMRERLDAARKKVMSDPKIQQLQKEADEANREFRDAVRDAMVKADPELAEWIKERIEKRKHGGDGPTGGFGNLSEGERQKLMNARSQAEKDPAVVAAEQKKRNARSPEERRAAADEFHKVMRDALLRVDPSLAPILDKMKPLSKPGPGAPDEMMEPPGA